MAYLFTSGGTAPKTNLSDIRYEEEQELQQVAWRFMKKRDKERKAREAKEQARAEKEKLKAQKKALKDLQKSGAKKTVITPLLEKDMQCCVSECLRPLEATWISMPCRSASHVDQHATWIPTPRGVWAMSRGSTSHVSYRARCPKPQAVVCCPHHIDVTDDAVRLHDVTMSADITSRCLPDVTSRCLLMSQCC
ncbi:uncharacterized protein [Cherax quadricarinatus]|uniref:uncharacterized protein isoform X2 n=1 Tax=Cherax quadricarinatus TaxID=27406 RepID=UPI00387EBC1C